MPPSQSYPVTVVEVTPPQPHLRYSSRAHSHLLCSGWSACVCAGVLAVSFLVCVFLFGRQKLFLLEVDPSLDLVLTLKQGSLRVYPFPAGLDIGIESRYSTPLPPDNLPRVVSSLDALFAAYPRSPEDGHRKCWLENPSPERPCFFDAAWLGEVCTPQHSYGYEERDGHYSPCFVLRLEQTGDWTPRFTDHIPEALADHYDPGFSPVHCHAKDGANLTVYPPKGFSHLFFPAARFEPRAYLPPMVAVKVHQIPKGSNLTLECSVVSPNAFFLWNNGRAVVRFEARK